MKKLLFSMGILVLLAYSVQAQSKVKPYGNIKNKKVNKVILSVENDVLKYASQVQEFGKDVEEWMSDNQGMIPSDTLFAMFVSTAIELNSATEWILILQEETLVDFENKEVKIRLSEKVQHDMERTRVLLDAVHQYIQLQNQLYRGYLIKQGFKG